MSIATLRAYFHKFFMYVKYKLFVYENLTILISLHDTQIVMHYSAKE